MNAPAPNTELDTNSQSGFPPVPPEAHQQAHADPIELPRGGWIESASSRHAGMTATYSPEDNKLRLYSVSRLDSATYERVKAAGFKWAPKQELFVAPMWTPARADLLVELCGEIDDEDTSLVERAEERADRFSEYREKRAGDADRAHEAVHRIADHIPMGQPILVGHHSERHARRDQERIRNGMRQAVKMWETSQYWKARAAGALAHAKYKELPEVRYRRIKGLEADLRKQLKGKEEAEVFVKLWSSDKLDHERAIAIANRMPYGSWTFPLKDFPRDPPASQYEGSVSIWSALTDAMCSHTQARDRVLPAYARNIARAERWIEHYTNRLAYERAMLGETGGIAAAKFDLQVGGRVLVAGTWSTIVRVNRKDGEVVSVSTNSRRWPRVPTVEEIRDYQAPTEEAAAKAKAATKLAPLCNYPHENFIRLTKAEWEKIYKDYKATRTIGQGAPGDRYDRFDKAPYEMYGPHRVRSCMASAVAGQRHTGGLVLVYITDLKTTQPPMPHEVPPVPEKLEPPVREVEAPRAVHTAPEAAKFDALKETLRTGVSVVAVPQLFPTPTDLARRMVELAGLKPHARVLEPSAGTGAILRAVREATQERSIAVRTAVEIDSRRVAHLRMNESGAEVIAGDFLACTVEQLGRFDAVLMNPPFANAVDIKHVQHAVQFLKPGGTLVAICAAGPRQHAQLQPLVEQHGGVWEPLPEGTFEHAGTNVRTVLLWFTTSSEAEAVTA